MYVCTCLYMRIFVYLFMGVYVVCVYICLHVYKCGFCMFIRVDICTHVRMYPWIYECCCMCTCVFVSVCMYVAAVQTAIVDSMDACLVEIRKSNKVFLFMCVCICACSYSFPIFWVYARACSFAWRCYVFKRVTLQGWGFVLAGVCTHTCLRVFAFYSHVFAGGLR